jgi:hypothetical protein
MMLFLIVLILFTLAPIVGVIWGLISWIVKA